ncbi:MAG TPA: PIN domain-containing protein [Methylomirabilota bacterium]|nr:PIN domain-containing protein [Methylomirabilota bacterium]
MRAYADSSFLVRLITAESSSAQSIAAYRQLGRPALFFLGLHALEVQTAILQRAFVERRNLSGPERLEIRRRRDSSFGRLQALIKRGSLVEVEVDLAVALNTAKELSLKHTEQLGLRSIDLLHVACGMLLKTEVFLTNDKRQAVLAQAEGIRTEMAE